jgi:hypothetical protein
LAGFFRGDFLIGILFWVQIGSFWIYKNGTSFVGKRLKMAKIWVSSILSILARILVSISPWNQQINWLRILEWIQPFHIPKTCSDPWNFNDLFFCLTLESFSPSCLFIQPSISSNKKTLRLLKWMGNVGQFWRFLVFYPFAFTNLVLFANNDMSLGDFRFLSG